jgi:hypothetical protein
LTISSSNIHAAIQIRVDELIQAVQAQAVLKGAGCFCFAMQQNDLFICPLAAKAYCVSKSCPACAERPLMVITAAQRWYISPECNVNFQVPA